LLVQPPRIALAVAGGIDNATCNHLPDDIGLSDNMKVLASTIEGLTHDMGHIGIEGGALEIGKNFGHRGALSRSARAFTSHCIYSIPAVVDPSILRPAFRTSESVISTMREAPWWNPAKR
jgi:hypothetical protein